MPSSHALLRWRQVASPNRISIVLTSIKRQVGIERLDRGTDLGDDRRRRGRWVTNRKPNARGACSSGR